MSDSTRKNAFIFPGQGSQKPHMAKPWENLDEFKYWEQASDTLGFNVTRLGLEAEEDELKEPANCQIALFVHHYVILQAAKAKGLEAQITAGHSLGEYDALVAADILTFEDALKLVHVRATSTENAAKERPGTMIACLGFDREDIEKAAQEAGSYLANENAPGQVTVSGSAEALEKTKALLEGKGKRILDLPVGAAYHSPHVEAAVEILGKALDEANFKEAQIPVVANVDAQIHEGQTDWADILRRQLVNPVLWRDSVETMIQNGVTDFIELGASGPLTGMIKRIARDKGRHLITTPEELSQITEEILGA